MEIVIVVSALVISFFIWLGHKLNGIFKEMEKKDIEDSFF